MHPPRRTRAAGAALVASLVLLVTVPADAAVPAHLGAPAVLALPSAVPVPSPDPPVDLTVPSPDPAAGSEVVRAQVAALTAQVDQMDVQAEIAVEDWNAVTAELDALVTQEVQAQAALDDAGRALQADRAVATRRVRALYRAGGTTEIAWTVLAGATDGTGTGLAQAASGFQAARVVLDSDAASVERARGRVDVAVTSSSQVQRLRRERAVLQTEAEERRRAAETALLVGRELLAAADDVLVEVVERERQEADRAALEAALEAARAAAVARAAAAAQTVPAGLALQPADLVGMTSAERAQALAQEAAGSAGPGGGAVRAGDVGADLQAVLERAAATAPSATAAAAIRAAGSRIGVPYTWGATGPATFDCSGLTMWAYAQAGLRLPRTSRQQYAGLPRVTVSSLLPGDLIFYANGSDPGSIHHVSIWLGDGLILTAPRTGDVVKISAVWRQPIYGAVRPAG